MTLRIPVPGVLLRRRVGRTWPFKAGIGLAFLGASFCLGAVPVEVRVVDQDGRPLPEAVVFLESREARAAVRPVIGAEIAQVGKQFVPQVTVVTLGTEVRFPNRDEVRHHVYSFSATKTFELKLYIGTPANPVLFDRPGVGVLGCNIHDHMIAWVVVVETPYYGMTGPDGRVRLEAAAGSYRLRTWHPEQLPGAPALDQSLQVAAASVAATVTMPVAGAPR